MRETLVLIIPGDAGDLAPNQRLHWREVHRRERAWHWRAWCAWQHAGSPRFAAVRLSFTLRRGRKLDEDNAAGSRALKAIVDGLKDQRMVRGLPLPVIEKRMFVDDEPKHVQRGEVRQETGKEWRQRPEVVVTVEVME